MPGSDDRDVVWTLDDYYRAIEKSLAEHDIESVPILLVMMATDGYGHEAEELRRQLVKATER